MKRYYLNAQEAFLMAREIHMLKDLQLHKVIKCLRIKKNHSTHNFNWKKTSENDKNLTSVKVV